MTAAELIKQIASNNNPHVLVMSKDNDQLFEIEAIDYDPELNVVALFLEWDD